MHLGMTGVTCHYQVTVTLTLTSDLVLRIIVSGAYLLYSLSSGFQIWCVDASWDSGVSCTILGHCDLDLDLVFRIIVSRAYLLYYLR